MSSTGRGISKYSILRIGSWTSTFVIGGPTTRCLELWMEHSLPVVFSDRHYCNLQYPALSNSGLWRKDHAICLTLELDCGSAESASPGFDVSLIRLVIRFNLQYVVMLLLPFVARQYGGRPGWVRHNRQRRSSPAYCMSIL